MDAMFCYRANDMKYGRCLQDGLVEIDFEGDDPFHPDAEALVVKVAESSPSFRFG